MIELNGPAGLGDAIYIRAIAEHLLRNKERVKVYTRWPDVFHGMPIELGAVCEVDRLIKDAGRSPEQSIRHVTACLHCQVPMIMALDKFTLACLQAGMSEPVELRITWRTRNEGLTRDLRARAKGRKLLVYQPIRLAKGPAQEIVRPKAKAFHRLVAEHDEFFRVKVGHSDYVRTDMGLPCEIDLLGKLTIADVLDVVASADTVFAEDCYLPILAQALDKPFTCMFSRRALSSGLNKARSIRPERSFNKPHLGRAVFDEE